MDKNELSKIDLVVLCGGQGSRIKSVVLDKPKILADVQGRPLLDFLLRKFEEQGFRRIILCVGYLGHKIVDYCALNKDKYSLDMVISSENNPIGTGGALKNAEKLVRSAVFFVMNGDMILNLDFSNFFEFHKEKKGGMSMVLAGIQEENDYGNVLVDNNFKIIGFKEKNFQANDKALISAGTYLMSRDIFSIMPSGAFSLEYDFFPKVIKNNCYGFFYSGIFLDIGTPYRYDKANKIGLL